MQRNPLANEDKGSVSITADGVKTWTQALNELFALIDTTKVSSDSKIEWTSNGNIIVCLMRDFNSNRIRMSMMYVDSASVSLDLLTISASSSWKRCNLTNSITYTDRSTNCPLSGDKIEFRY